MTLPVVVRPEAQNDLVRARDWYEEQQAGLGPAFSNSIEEILGRIVAMPEMYPAAVRNVRRGKVRRFPYLVYYRVLPNRIEVVAILHSSRDPKVWRNRANEAAAV